VNRKLIASLTACLVVAGASRNGSAELIHAIANQGVSTSLISFDSQTPGNLASGVFLSGLQTNETIVGIDFRPANGQLYALGSSSRLYTINRSTGAVTQVGSPLSTPLNGFNFGFDFNPMIDRIRVVSDVNQNLVLNPDTGAVQLVATNVFYPAGDANAGVDPNVVSSAYDQNVVGTNATQLYGIDTGLDILVRQANNAGTLTTVGSLGANYLSSGGFDVSNRAPGLAYASLVSASGSASSLYRINLATGAATSLGVVNGGLTVTAMAVDPVVPEPSTSILAILGLASVMVARRRAG
jgi:hypothetical protein